MYTQMENKKKTSLMLNSSSREMTNSVSGLHKVGLGSRHKWSLGSLTRKGSILAGHRGSKLSVLDDRSEVPKAVQVLDDDGNDVTPVALSHEEPGDKFKQGKFFLEEILHSSRSERLKSTSTFNLTTGSSFMCSSTSSSMRASMTKESEDSILDTPTLPPALPPAPYEVPRKRYNVEQQVTEEMLGEEVDILLHETDVITLLDLPNTSVSEDAEEAEAIEKANIQYAELCKNRMGNDKYVARPTQTFNEALKNKQIQGDEIVKVDKGTMATIWDIYDSFCEEVDSPENEGADFPENGVNITNGQEKKDVKSSSCSTVTTGSTVSSLLEKETSWSSSSTEPNTQLIMSESFKHNLLVMERSVKANLIQPKLAAYRKLPLQEDPDIAVLPGEEEQSKESEESSSSPSLEPLWCFTCELTRGCNITCMALNKENPDLLAVGYGDLDSFCPKTGFICCWSLKNPSWPERVFHCHSSVTSLDFSSKNSGQLAVGMFDGTVSIYNATSLNNKACIASSSECPKRHQHPVWQVRYTKQQMSLSGDDSVENVISVSADGRVTKWLLGSNGLDCIDLMKLSRTQSSKKKEGSVLPEITPGLGIDFHPTDSSVYLVGTYEGKIHKCSISDNQHLLGTYSKHICPVNRVEWSPICHDVFLSCSSDWSIQLWRQDLSVPVLSFTPNEIPVRTLRWSPHWSSVFAAIRDQQLEIWDLNSNILNPTIVHQAPPGVKFTSLQFIKGTDCLFVGDSDGEVAVYKIKNLNVEGNQVNSLDDIVRPIVSRQLTSQKALI